MYGVHMCDPRRVGGRCSLWNMYDCEKIGDIFGGAITYNPISESGRYSLWSMFV